MTGYASKGALPTSANLSTPPPLLVMPMMGHSLSLQISPPPTGYASEGALATSANHSTPPPPVMPVEGHSLPLQISLPPPPPPPVMPLKSLYPPSPCYASGGALPTAANFSNPPLPTHIDYASEGALLTPANLSTPPPPPPTPSIKCP